MDIQEKNAPGRNKGGRPSKKEDEKLTKTVKARIRIADFDYLQEIHKQEQLFRRVTFQQYLRELLLSRSTNKLQGPKKTKQLQAGTLILQFDSISKELKAIRANHNQTVKKINALPLTKELKKQLQENYKLEQEIIAILHTLNRLFQTLQQTISGDDF